ncbi:extracellular solute-binding protein (plasmid) [Embleya sp. NBC_00896]|nr:extracellular solute-binding protein [Embleya sp. NBC_00896]
MVFGRHHPSGLSRRGLLRVGAGAAVATALSGCGGTDDGVGADGRVTIEMWHGQTDTGPWQIPDITQAQIEYHVVPLPSYSGRPMTICGPDTWTVFDNGGARVRAARTFVSWLAQPDQDVEWDMQVGSLPLSRARPEWRSHAAETAGLDVFTRALETARVRPAHPAYPQISMALGEAIVSVLLGKSSPARALNRCAATAKAALVIPR